MRMGGAELAENRWTLGSQGVGMAMQRWKQVVGSKQAAKDRVFLNALQKNYIRKWTSIGIHDEEECRSTYTLLKYVQEGSEKKL
ncbi:jg18885 [Pararge aegeria aegeria]|uniref:Jg18885 protein n=1 Tax=Pararge aegeria aegeria TaxID=348720 RepID=A0A8S4RXM3_9NEOP|nr:jg18885 [Pararge aegeria aegeria]